jgi:hypothetical protein
MIFNHLQVLKSLFFTQHAIACVLYELLCLELFYKYSYLRNKVPLQVFDIVQFSRSCRPTAVRRRAYLVYQIRLCLSSTFFEVFPALSLFDQEQIFETRVPPICFALTLCHFRCSGGVYFRLPLSAFVLYRTRFGLASAFWNFSQVRI